LPVCPPFNGSGDFKHLQQHLNYTEFLTVVHNVFV